VSTIEPARAAGAFDTAAAAPVAPAVPRGPFAAFSVRAYPKVFTSGALWNLARWMALFSGAYLVRELTDSPLQVQLVGTASFLPMFLGGIAAGAVADRSDRRRTVVRQLALLVPLAAVNAVLARPIERLIDAHGVRVTLLAGALGLVVASAALPLLTLSTQWWLVLLLMAGVGIPFAFALISLTQTLYRTAPPANVGQAAGLFQTARSVGCITAATVVGVSFSGPTGTEDWLVLSLVVAGAAIVFAAAAALTGRGRSRRTIPVA